MTTKTIKIEGAVNAKLLSEVVNQMRIRRHFGTRSVGAGESMKIKSKPNGKKREATRVTRYVKKLAMIAPGWTTRRFAVESWCFVKKKFLERFEFFSSRSRKKRPSRRRTTN
jgi:hypothetical protein